MVMSVTGTKELIDYRVESGVAVVQLDDPPANTYSYEMMQQLDAAILRARMDETVHVVILRGAGDRFFCAGANWLAGNHAGSLAGYWRDAALAARSWPGARSRVDDCGANHGI